MTCRFSKGDGVLISISHCEELSYPVQEGNWLPATVIKTNATNIHGEVAAYQALILSAGRLYVSVRFDEDRYIRAKTIENMILCFVSSGALEREIRFEDFKGQHRLFFTTSIACENIQAMKWYFSKSAALPREYNAATPKDALIVAAESNKKRVIVWLLETFLDLDLVSTVDSMGRNIAHIAAIHGYGTLVRKSVEWIRGFDHKIIPFYFGIDSFQRFPLHYATEKGNVHVLQAFCYALSCFFIIPDQQKEYVIAWMTSQKDIHGLSVLDLAQRHLRKSVLLVTVLRRIEINLIDMLMIQEITFLLRAPKHGDIGQKHLDYFRLPENEAILEKILQEVKNEEDLFQLNVEYAIRQRQIEKLKLLIGSISVSNPREMDIGYVALFFAANGTWCQLRGRWFDEHWYADEISDETAYEEDIYEGDMLRQGFLQWDNFIAFSSLESNWNGKTNDASNPRRFGLSPPQRGYPEILKWFVYESHIRLPPCSLFILHCDKYITKWFLNWRLELDAILLTKMIFSDVINIVKSFLGIEDYYETPKSILKQIVSLREPGNQDKALFLTHWLVHEKGVDPFLHRRSNQSETALHYAIDSRLSGCIKFLVTYDRALLKTESLSGSLLPTSLALSKPFENTDNITENPSRFIAKYLVEELEKDNLDDIWSSVDNLGRTLRSFCTQSCIEDIIKCTYSPGFSSPVSHLCLVLKRCCETLSSASLHRF